MPLLEVETQNLEEKVQIKIRDNGMGTSDPNSYFHSFTDVVLHMKDSSLELSLAHDIIVHVHHGEITVNSKQGENTEIIITLAE